MKFKLTSLEKKWVLYDVGNSAFTMMVSTIFPIYFNYLASSAYVSEVNYLAFWGYATSAATIITALLGPVLWNCLRLPWLEETALFDFPFDRSLRLYRTWFFKLMDLVSPDLYPGKGGILSESDLL